ncbi:LOW QUALITY PROTEIN: uncharacterized protein LOC135196625 [Macrobrachium nipponense]|uniref:LOW QUALITY PROTEIN: uncharacterized protein LOC135196625 n=1 Tax=Macrobrachium nipponense TaxID=159736 RepID=UPI0030C88EE5
MTEQKLNPLHVRDFSYDAGGGGTSGAAFCLQSEESFAPPSETRRTPTEIDLSGRHLERLPTILFSSLHLTTINLSHNLLALSPVGATSAANAASTRSRRKSRRRRGRRRRSSEPREPPSSSSKTRARAAAGEVPKKGAKDADSSDQRPPACEEANLSGDSGLPPDPVEVESPSKDQEGHERENSETAAGVEVPEADQVPVVKSAIPEVPKGPLVQTAVPEGPKKSEKEPSQLPNPEKGRVWQNLAEELQAKLKLRKALAEGLVAPVPPATDALSSEDAAGTSLNSAPDEAKNQSFGEVSRETRQSEVQENPAGEHVERKERRRRRSQDNRNINTGLIVDGCSGDDSDDDTDDGEGEHRRDSDSRDISSREEDTDSEGGGGGGGGVSCGGSRTGRILATSRSLGGLDNLKHFLQLQVVVLSENRLQEFPPCLLSLPALLRLDLSRNQLRCLPDSFGALGRLEELEVSYNRLVGVGAGVASLPALTRLGAAYNRIATTQHVSTMERLRHLNLTGNHLKEVPFSAPMPDVVRRDGDVDGGVLPRECLHYQPDGGGGGGGGGVDEVYEGRRADSEPLSLNLRLNNLTGPVTLASIQEEGTVAIFLAPFLRILVACTFLKSSFKSLNGYFKSTHLILDRQRANRKQLTIYDAVKLKNYIRNMINKNIHVHSVIEEEEEEEKEDDNVRGKQTERQSREKTRKENPSSLRLCLSSSRWSANDRKNPTPKVLCLDGSHLKNVTELDVSENGISSLDVSCLTCLTSLVCSNNAITTITLHGATLTALTADNNKLSRLDVRYHPRRLTKLSLAKNQLNAVPPWLVSSTEASLVDVSYNNLSSLPAFLTSGHLRRLHTLSAHHNNLSALTIPQRPPTSLLSCQDQSFNHYGSANSPYRSSHEGSPASRSSSAHSGGNSLHEEPRLCSLETLLLHHNKITSLPSNLFTWLNRLRVLNISANQIKTLPAITEGGRSGRDSSNSEEDVGGPKATLPLQEFYAASNNLRDLTPLQHCRALCIIHAPYNKISNLQDRLVWSWELLEELVLAGNHLTSVPSGVSRLRRLRVLKVHSNPLRSLPRLAHLSVLKVVDASHCQLGRVELEEVVSPGLVALDISANTALSLDHHQFTKCKSRRPVSVVDVTSRCGRSLPLTRPKASVHKGDANGSNENNHDTTPKLPWSLGFAESIGRDSRLTVGQLRVPDVGGLGRVGLAAVADGGKEVGSISSLLAALPTLLQEERACSHTHTYSLKYALLTALRRLRSQGSVLPEAVCAAHLESDPSNLHHFPVLRLCCYGSVSAAVTTVHAKPVVLTTSASKFQRMETTRCYEGSKCVLAEAPLIPDPHTIELHLGPSHTAVIIASASFWEVIDPEEAGDICSEVAEPGLAAKKLLDLAQAYGTRQALSVIVVRLLPPSPIPQFHTPVITSSLMHSKSSVGEKCRINQGNHEHQRSSDSVGKYLPVNLEKRRNENLRSQANRNDTARVEVLLVINLKGRMLSKSTPNLEELDRSSPSGQSQSDNSEPDADIQKYHSTRTHESNLVTNQRAVCKSIEDLYAKPHRRKSDVSKTRETDIDSFPNQISNNRKAVTYYHYPRPDPNISPPQNHLTDHLLTMGQMIHPPGVLAPPAGFGDLRAILEGSDPSGLSGVSAGHMHSNQKHLDDDLIDSQEQVTEEQFRSWEYLLARNAKLLFMRELDTLTRSNSKASNLPTASAPDLLAATAAETESSGHFLRNTVRKSRLGRGTFRLIQNKLSATTSKFSTLQRFRSNAGKHESNFRRFGSLQNLKYYQENRPRPPHYPLVQPDLGTEMQERTALDSLELETRMHHYWHTGVTNF